MNISELISTLEQKREEFGDIEVMLIGHPGEYGFPLEDCSFFERDHESIKTLFIVA